MFDLFSQFYARILSQKGSTLRMLNFEQAKHEYMFTQECQIYNLICNKNNVLYIKFNPILNIAMQFLSSTQYLYRIYSVLNY